MPINEESKQDYLQARDVFVESYKDFLRKLLGLLDEAEHSTGDAEVRRDVAHFADEVKILKRHIDDFQTEEERAKQAVGSASSEGIPRGASQEGSVGRASSPGEEAELTAQKDQDPTPVPLLGSGSVPQTTTTSVSEKSLQRQSGSQTKSESADELQAEVESAPSQLSASEEAPEEVPQVFAPAATDDGRVVSAFCAFRYHKAEFRQLFMRQGSNNSCCAAAAAAAAAAARDAAMNNASSCGKQLDAMLQDPPSWLAPLAQYTLHLMRRAFRTASPEQWEALKSQLAGFGFKAEEHFALWLRISATAQEGAAAQSQDPGRVFNAIPPLAGLPKRLASETRIMLQTLNLLSE